MRLTRKHALKMHTNKTLTAFALLFGLLGACLATPLAAKNNVLYVAVATNFRTTMQPLIRDFESQYPGHIVASYASTGKLYAQIRHGAPFQIFLAADKQRPQKLLTDGLGVAASQHTYAIGRLVLWQPNSTQALDHGSSLQHLKRLAMANPKTAPYGLAAAQVLHTLHQEQAQPQRIFGENIAQTFQFVGTGNVQAGLVALSQILSQSIPESDYWLIPAHYHEPILQQSVLLKTAAKHPLAQQFYAYLYSDAAKEIIRKHGYGVMEGGYKPRSAEGNEASNTHVKD